MPLPLRKTRPLTLCPTVLCSLEKHVLEAGQFSELARLKRTEYPEGRRLWARPSGLYTGTAPKPRVAQASTSRKPQIQPAPWTEEHGGAVPPPASFTDVPTAPLDPFSRSLKPGLSTIPCGQHFTMEWSSTYHCGIWVILSKSHSRPFTYPEAESHERAQPDSTEIHSLGNGKDWLLPVQTLSQKRHVSHIRTFCSPCLSALTSFPMCLFLHSSFLYKVKTRILIIALSHTFVNSWSWLTISVFSFDSLSFFSLIYTPPITKTNSPHSPGFSLVPTTSVGSLLAFPVAFAQQVALATVPSAEKSRRMGSWRS